MKYINNATGNEMHTRIKTTLQQLLQNQVTY